MDKPVVFYDCDCGLCNRSVQFVLKHEKRPEVNFSALQSTFTKTLFSEKNWPQPDMSTFYFWDGHKLYSKSTAVLKLAGYLRFPRNLLQVGFIFPTFIRNAVYGFIAKRRHTIVNGQCLLPSPDELKRFIR